MRYLHYLSHLMIALFLVSLVGALVSGYRDRKNKTKDRIN